MTSSALPMVCARSNGVALCGATTSSHCQAPPVGVVPCMPAEIASSSSGPDAAGPAVRRAAPDHGRPRGERLRDAGSPATARAAPPAASQTWTRRRDRSSRPSAIPTSR